MSENWVEVEGYPAYAVSDHGRVMNIQQNHVLRGRPNSKGYLRVRLSDGRSLKDFYIHKLVGYAFYRFPLEEHTIHYDGDQMNNRASNLRLRKRVRTDVNTRPLQGPEVDEYRRQWGKRVMVIETGDIFRTVRDCARFINGDHSAIYSCLRGTRETHRGLTFRYYDW